jgi:hypothetical protein
LLGNVAAKACPLSRSDDDCSDVDQKLLP